MDSERQPRKPDPWEQVLPGMGIIRIRALRKQGFNTLELIAGADPAALLRVPGFTEAKAAQVIEAAAAALADVVPERESAASDPVPVVVDVEPEPAPPVDPPAPAADEAAATPEPAVVEPVVDVWPVTVLFSSVELVAHEAEVLLRPWRSVDFSKGLCRQLKRWVQFAQYLEEFGIRAGVPVGREIERLKGLQGLLTDALTAERVGARKQRRLAEALRKRRRALQRKFKEDDDAVVS